MLNRDVFNARSGTIIGVALTSQPPRSGFPLALALQAQGLPKRSWALMGQIRTLSVERLGRKLARASAEEVAQIVEGLNEIIGE